MLDGLDAGSKPFHGLNGCFEAAKKVALALHSLIKMQYPRDRLYVIGFSEYAHELQHEDIPSSSWGSYYPGTNMQHALGDRASLAC